MEKKKYFQPRMKILPLPQLLQSFELSGGGDAGGGVAKRNNSFEELEEEEKSNVWNTDW